MKENTYTNANFFIIKKRLKTFPLFQFENKITRRKEGRPNFKIVKPLMLDTIGLFLLESEKLTHSLT